MAGIKKEVEDGGEALPEVQYPPLGGKRSDGGPAFPGQNRVWYFYGMSLRDWFAGMALTNYFGEDPSAECIAKRCYGVADAMIRERENGQK